MSLHCGREPEHPEETNADMGRTWEFHTERLYPSPESNPRHLLATAPLRTQPLSFFIFKCSHFCVLSLKKYFLDISYECLFCLIYSGKSQLDCLAAAQCKHSLICCAAPLNQLRVKGLAQVHLYDDNDNVIKT